MMEQNSVMLTERRTNFLKNITKEEKLDDTTFSVWKTELLKELPLFWETMQKSRK